MKISLILMSHGHMAEETLNSAKMIVGEVENVSIVQMEHDDGMEGVKEKLQNVLSSYSNKPVLIMADLYGGTPFNVAVILGKLREHTKIIAGFNLGMVIECLTSDETDIDKLVDYLIEEGKEAIRSIEEDDDDIDIE